jgi:hypothetical protein
VCRSVAALSLSLSLTFPEAIRALARKQRPSDREETKRVVEEKLSQFYLKNVLYIYRLISVALSLPWPFANEFATLPQRQRTATEYPPS